MDAPYGLGNVLRLVYRLIDTEAGASSLWRRQKADVSDT